LHLWHYSVVSKFVVVVVVVAVAAAAAAAAAVVAYCCVQTPFLAARHLSDSRVDMCHME